MRKREIIWLLKFCATGFAEALAIIFFCIAVYFFLCLIA